MSFRTYVDKKIQKLFESRVGDLINNAVSDCRDQIYDEHRMNQAGFEEDLEDGISEVQNSTRVGVAEIDEQVRNYLCDMEEQAQQHMNNIEDRKIDFEVRADQKIAELKHLDHASAQSLVDSSKSSLSHRRGANARRSSI